MNRVTAAMPTSVVRDANPWLLSAQGVFLQDLARMNEDIKAVVELSRSIGLGAINAGLVANKCSSGADASGFGVATVELRSFSGKLEVAMSRIEEAVSGQIAEAARLQKMVRRRNALDEAESGCGLGLLCGRVTDMDVAIMLALSAQGAWRGEVQSILLRAEQIARGGHVAARVARLEAVNGGGQAAGMTMAAYAIEEQVLRVLEIIKKLVAQVGCGR